MSDKVVEIQTLLGVERLATEISLQYDEWSNKRNTWVEERKESRNYLFATDTSTTSNSDLEWKNKTTLPKLTQIRDNLHANYMAALFPNDRWFKWEGYTQEAVLKKKREAIEEYMRNKVRESGFMQTVSRLVYDYIDDGNCFGDTEYVNELITDPETGELTSGYVGPKVIRISPFDIVFNPIAPSFMESAKIIRTIKNIGDVKKEILNRPEMVEENQRLVDKLFNIRDGIAMYKAVDVDKAAGFSIDGFGDLNEYYGSNYVEILTFEGDIYDTESATLLENRRIVIADRSYIIYNDKIANWSGRSNKVHGGWRYRPDNLYAMGPLDNLVGMQYRIDHLENLKADAMDFTVFPPIGIKGNVEEFDWGPNEEIYLGDEGDIIELGKNLNGVIAADNNIALYEEKMEEFAGAPKQAMGIRTPGEKTAFEVQTLENASGRIFQHKVTQFEQNVIEPLLNNMLEVSRRNMSTSDVVRVMDDDVGVVNFMTITKEDITAAGKLRPIGARHFAAQAQLIQNLQGIVNSPIFQIIQNHISPKALAKMVEEVMGFERFQFVKENALLSESAETEGLQATIQDDLAVESTLPVEEGVEDAIV